jgi:DNA-binding CsgD family transcriptional regulator
MASAIVGRDKELGLLHAFVGRAIGESAALVLEGEAGIGKSTLWLAGVEYARAQGFRILSSRPAEAERGLAHVGLSDLFENVLEEVLPYLALPRRRAIEAALLLEEDSGSVDPRALGTGTRSALQVIAEDQPLVVAIDDIQWFDAASAAALAFALRRLGRSRVLLLLARRIDDRAQPSELELTLAAGSVERLPVGPLSVGAIHQLLFDQLDRPFARQTLLRIHERSGGNPFFALELARVLDENIDPTQSLPVPETLEELVRARISGLPTSTREALAFASALGAPSEALLEQAGISSAAFEPAAAARVIERRNGTIRFTHPLLSSVLYQNLGEERRGVHARIAEIAEDPLLHARHLALSEPGPSSEIAGSLDAAAILAADRGASALAAELAEQAFRLTAPDAHSERHRRALAAARAHLAAGEWTRARSIATDLLVETESGSLRAEVLILLAELEIDDPAVPLLEDALREAAERPALQATIHIRLAESSRFRRGFAGALEDARRALALADDLDDDALRLDALGVVVWLGGMVGDADTVAHAARARELATAAGDPNLVKEANALAGVMLLKSGSLDAARGLLEREYEGWRERDELFSASILWELSWVELWSGRWELAADHAARARDINLQYGLERNQDYIPTAWVAAHRGQLELARTQAERGLELCEEQVGFHPPLLLAVPGLVALWGGDASAAEEWFGNADRQAAALGWGEPEMRPWSADYVEALLALDRADDAVVVLDVWEADATRLGRERVLAQVTRCRGLVAAAQGRVAEAASLLGQAAAQHQDVGDAFGQARALLALGIVRRRTRQKRAARDAIDAAIEGFERLGAATWIEKARAELGSVGGRTREERLTTSERRVAALVAAGRTNREVAAELFLAERTVAGHLTRVYGKLGVRSRTELARRLN